MGISKKLWNIKFVFTGLIAIRNQIYCHIFNQLLFQRNHTAEVWAWICFFVVLTEIFGMHQHSVFFYIFNRWHLWIQNFQARHFSISFVLSHHFHKNKVSDVLFFYSHTHISTQLCSQDSCRVVPLCLYRKRKAVSEFLINVYFCKECFFLLA